jgi:hypothetical protein
VDSSWDEIDRLMADIVASGNPYPAALKAMGAAMSSGSDLLGGVYLIWGSLTDGVELHPEDSAKYLNQMRQAAENGSTSKTTKPAVSGLITGSTTCAATPVRRLTRSAGPLCDSWAVA